MKIKSIKFVLCQEELAKPIPLSCGVLSHRNFGLVRVETAGGIVGWGETSVNFPPWTYRERKATIEEGLAPLLIGEDATDVRKLRLQMQAATLSYTRMWAEGAITQAISGIEMALWDALGQETGTSLCKLLGGAFHREFDAYATGFRADDPAAGAREMVTKGYKTVKMRIGFDDDIDVAKAFALRTEVGDGINVMIDANQAFTYPRAKKMMAALQPLNLYWLEEPVLNDNFDAMAKLRRDFPDFPVAWGENAFSLGQYDRVIDESLVNYVMPDPCRCGGIGPAMDMAEIARQGGIPVSAHHYGSDVGFAAMLHFMATCPLVDHVLRDEAPVGLRDDLVVEDLSPDHGRVTLPDGPGLGITVNMAAVEKSEIRL